MEFLQRDPEFQHRCISIGASRSQRRDLSDAGVSGIFVFFQILWGTPVIKHQPFLHSHGFISHVQPAPPVNKQWVDLGGGGLFNNLKLLLRSPQGLSASVVTDFASLPAITSCSRH